MKPEIDPFLNYDFLERHFPRQARRLEYIGRGTLTQKNFFQKKSKIDAKYHYITQIIITVFSVISIILISINSNQLAIAFTASITGITALGAIFNFRDDHIRRRHSYTELSALYSEMHYTIRAQLDARENENEFCNVPEKALELWHEQLKSIVEKAESNKKVPGEASIANIEPPPGRI